VVQFQRSRGLSPTTVVDAQTAGMLGRAVGELPEETVLIRREPKPEPNPEPKPEPKPEPEPATVVHQALDAIGVDVEGGTPQALARLQAMVGLEPTGRLDESTMSLARAALQRLAPGENGKEGAFVVEGMVTDANGLPLAG
jgi:hypothetical protein